MPTTNNSNDDNNDDDQNPFANLTVETYVPIYHSKSKKKPKKPNESMPWNRSNIYFENSTKENDFIKLVPYIGPSNTMHLNQSLYLPQLIPNEQQQQHDLSNILKCFTTDYEQITESYTPSSYSVYIRFGISYITRAASSLINEKIPFKHYLYARNHGKELKTSFYTCKGVTSPKQLLSTIVKQNYESICSNAYTYEIQIYGKINDVNSVLHFQYNEDFECQSVFHRMDFPVNFDFIRDKTASQFRSIDESYSDIFDFRVQLVRQKEFSKTDPKVLQTLRDVPIDQVLSMDPSTQMLHVTSKLQKFVKYFRCTRSNNYQNLSEHILISIGSYEEFQLNHRGQCQSLMKASNTMVIEFLDMQTPPSAKKLFDIGMWFSSLCQTCVDLPTVAAHQMNMPTFKWFCDVVKKRSYQSSVKSMGVNELTTYKTQKSQQTYTHEELKFVKHILREENLREIFIKSDDTIEQIDTLNEKYKDITNRLRNSEVPSAKLALKKVDRAYHLIMKESFLM